MPAESEPLPTLGSDEVTVQEWDALARHSRNVFATRAWLETWRRREAPDREVRTVVARREDGTLGALLPLVVHRRRPRVLRPLGPFPPPAAPLICAPEEQDWAVREVGARLQEQLRWDVVDLGAVPVEQAWRGRFGRSTFDEEPSVTIDIRGRTWTQLLAGASRSSRSDIVRRRRRLAERHHVELRRTDAATVRSDVDQFLRLHWMRWGRRAHVLTRQRAGFLHDFAAQAAALGWLALWSLYLDGRPAAALLDLRFAGREIAFMAGRDPRFAKDYVGLGLLFAAVEDAAGAGLDEFALLQGAQPYKARLPHRVGTVRRVLVAGSPTGALTLAAQRGRRAVGGRLTPLRMPPEEPDRTEA